MNVTPEELRSFGQIVSRQIENGTAMSLEQCMRQWREEYERAGTIAAVQRGEADIEPGRFQTLAEFDADFRKEFGVPLQAQFQIGGNDVCR